MNYAAWEFWIGIAQLVGTVLIALYLGLVSRSRHNAKQHRDHEIAVDKRLDAVEKEVARLHERMHHMPDSTSQSAGLGRAHSRIDALSERVSVMLGHLDGMKSSLGRVNEYLLNQPK